MPTEAEPEVSHRPVTNLLACIIQLHRSYIVYGLPRQCNHRTDSQDTVTPDATCSQAVNSKFLRPADSRDADHNQACLC